MLSPLLGAVHIALLPQFTVSVGIPEKKKYPVEPRRIPWLSRRAPIEESRADVVLFGLRQLHHGICQGTAGYLFFCSIPMENVNTASPMRDNTSSGFKIYIWTRTFLVYVFLVIIWKSVHVDFGVSDLYELRTSCTFIFSRCYEPQILYQSHFNPQTWLFMFWVFYTTLRMKASWL